MVGSRLRASVKFVYRFARRRAHFFGPVALAHGLKLGERALHRLFIEDLARGPVVQDLAPVALFQLAEDGQNQVGALRRDELHQQQAAQQVQVGARLLSEGLQVRGAGHSVCARKSAVACCPKEARVGAAETPQGEVAALERQINQPDTLALHLDFLHGLRVWSGHHINFAEELIEGGRVFRQLIDFIGLHRQVRQAHAVQ